MRRAQHHATRSHHTQNINPLEYRYSTSLSCRNGPCVAVAGAAWQRSSVAEAVDLAAAVTPIERAEKCGMTTWPGGRDWTTMVWYVLGAWVSLVWPSKLFVQFRPLAPGNLLEGRLQACPTAVHHFPPPNGPCAFCAFCAAPDSGAHWRCFCHLQQNPEWNVWPRGRGWCCPPLLGGDADPAARPTRDDMSRLFIVERRRRCDSTTSLPNMNVIPGTPHHLLSIASGGRCTIRRVKEAFGSAAHSTAPPTGRGPECVTDRGSSRL